jgi:hypothetical protein
VRALHVLVGLTLDYGANWKVADVCPTDLATAKQLPMKSDLEHDSSLPFSQAVSIVQSLTEILIGGLSAQRVVSN